MAHSSRSDPELPYRREVDVRRSHDCWPVDQCDGADLFKGDGGNDCLEGAANDVLLGGYGRDRLASVAGSDRLRLGLSACGTTPWANWLLPFVSGKTHNLRALRIADP